MVYIDATSLYYAAIGGALLGIATCINFGLRGKITGMSGLLYTLVSFNRSNSLYIQRTSLISSLFQEECSLSQVFSMEYMGTQHTLTLLILSHLDPNLKQSMDSLILDSLFQAFQLDLVLNYQTAVLVDMGYADCRDLVFDLLLQFVFS